MSHGERPCCMAGSAERKQRVNTLSEFSLHAHSTEVPSLSSNTFAPRPSMQPMLLFRSILQLGKLSPRKIKKLAQVPQLRGEGVWRGVYARGGYSGRQNRELVTGVLLPLPKSI